MLKVRVSKVTSEYLRDLLRVEPDVWYDAKWYDDEHDTAHVYLPTGVRFCAIGSRCAHLDDNEQTEWEVSDA